MSTTAVMPHSPDESWTLPSRGIIGMACLIVAESAIFIIFVVAYVFYLGKSLTGPAPRDVLQLPIFFPSACFRAVTRCTALSPPLNTASAAHARSGSH